MTRRTGEGRLRRTTVGQRPDSTKLGGFLRA